MSPKPLIVSLLLAFGCAILPAQMTNDAAGALVLNGVDGAAPNVVSAPLGGSLEIAVSGNPNRPFVLLFGASLQVGAQTFAPGIDLDIGPSPSITALANGFGSPLTNFFDAFANTGPTGQSLLTLPIPAQAAAGHVGALQAFVVDFTVPGFVAATAATDLFVQRAIPTVLATHETSSFNSSIAEIASPGAPQDLPGLSNLYVLNITLQRFGELTANDDTSFDSVPTTIPATVGSFYRRRPPTASEPRLFSEFLDGRFVRTIHGDIYPVRNMATGQDGFLRIHDGQAEILPGSLMVPASTSRTAWKSTVNVQDGLMVAVFQGFAAIPDRIHLLRIDGGVFASTGNAVLEITPTGPDTPTKIHSQSPTFAGNVLYFCADTAAGPKKLFRCDLSLPQPAPATPVVLPDISVSPLVPAARVDPDIRVTSDQSTLHLRVSDTTDQTTAIFRLDGITATGETVTPVVQAPAVHVIRNFGRGNTGRDGRFSRSPLGSRLAFVTQRLSSDELYVCNADGTGLIEVTDSTRFGQNLITVTDVEAWDEDHVLFWTGAGGTFQDLYDYRISTDVLTAITQSNGQSGATLPITNSPISRMDPMGQVRMGNRMLFQMRTVQQSGPDAGLTTSNFMGLDLTTLTPFNVTGSLVPGASAPNINSEDTGSRLAVSATSDVIWAIAVQPDSTLNDDLISFDLASGAPAAFHVNQPTPFTSSRSRIRSPQPSSDGGSCLAVQTLVNAAQGGRVLEAELSGALSIVVPDQTDTQYVGLLRFPDEAVVPGFFALRNDAPFVGGVSTFRTIDAVNRGDGSITPLASPLATSGTVLILGITVP